MSDRFILAFGLLLLVLITVVTCNRATCVEMGSAKDTVYVHDTVAVMHPVPVHDTIVRYVARRLPAAPCRHDSTASAATGRQDTCEVVLPISQRVYEDSLYKAWVSGYEASLDSIHLYTTTTNITTQVPVRTPARRKRWGIGVQAGYGVTLKQNPVLAPYVGIGVSYNLFNF